MLFENRSLIKGGRVLITYSMASILLTLAITTWAQYPPPVRQQPPQQQGPSLTVENATGYPVDILYVEGGEYKTYATIPVGRDMIQTQIQPGLTWHFGIQSHQAIIGEYTMTNSPEQRVVLDGQVLAAAGVPPTQQSGQRSIPGGSAKPQPLPPPTFSKKPDIPSDIPTKVEFDPNSVTTPTVPVGMRGPKVDWFQMPGEGLVTFSNGKDPVRTLKADENGVLVWAARKRGVTSQTDEAFFLQAVEGKKDVYRIQNAYYLDSYLHVDQNAREGSPIRSGPEGATSPGGEWIVSRESKRGTYYVIRSVPHPRLRIATRGQTVGLSSKDYFAEFPKPFEAESREYIGGDSFHMFRAEVARELLDLVPALVDMAEKIEVIKKQEQARKAEIERKQAEAEEAERQRRAIARVPKITSGGSATSSIGVRLGVGDVYDTETGAKAVRYTFSPPGPQPFLKGVIRATNPADNQYVHVNLNPEVAAWVEPDGTLYVGVDTGKGTSINMLTGDQPSSDSDTDGNWYIGNVRMSLQFQEGREVIWYPTVENRRVSFGVSSDVSRGVNVNLSVDEILGADISESSGTNVNWDAREFEISGQRGPGIPQMGSMVYQWDSCGLADKVKSTEPCTYTGPVDLHDPATLTLRKIPLSAHALQGLETRTVFKNYFPRSGISDRLYLTLDIDVQAHMVKIVRATKDNTKNKDWEDFKAGFTYVFRPDLWDTSKSLEDQHLLKDASQKPVGFTHNLKFRYALWVHIEDLRKYMEVDRTKEAQTAQVN